MAYAGKILHPIRRSLSLLNNQSKSISQSRQLFHCKFEPLKAWRRESLEPFLHNNISRFRHKLNIQRKYVQNFSLLGSKRVGRVFGLSMALGSVCFLPAVAYAMDGQDVLLDDYAVDLSSSSDAQEDPFAFWTFVKKFWMPTFFLLTVLVNWDHPIALGMKLVFLLFSTKPSPLSVYIYVEQLCQSMRQKPRLFLFKTLYANKVEVQDYKLLCIARVEVGDQKLTLVGILGGWWALPSSQGVISVFRERFRDKKFSDFARKFTDFESGFCC